MLLVDRVLDHGDRRLAIPHDLLSGCIVVDHQPACRAVAGLLDGGLPGLWIGEPDKVPDAAGPVAEPDADAEPFIVGKCERRAANNPGSVVKGLSFGRLGSIEGSPGVRAVAKRWVCRMAAPAEGVGPPPFRDLPLVVPPDEPLVVILYLSRFQRHSAGHDERAVPAHGDPHLVLGLRRGPFSRSRRQRAVSLPCHHVQLVLLSCF